METKVECKGIDKLKVTAKLVDEPVEGGEKGETETKLYTEVTFRYEGAPGRFDDVLWALASGHVIDVAIESPQLSMSVK